MNAKQVSLTFLLSLALVPAFPVSAEEFYAFPYSGAMSYMDPTGTIVGGALVCAEDLNAGGSCPALVVNPGDLLIVSPSDDLFGSAVGLGVCIDSAFDGICRPENADDTIFFGCGSFAGTYTGPPGALAIFVMQGQVDSELNVCLATTGTVFVAFEREDGNSTGYEPPMFYLH